MQKLLRSASICFASFALSFSTSGAEFQKVHVEDGTLYFEDGSEAVLWGVNFQPSLSWEHNRMARHGLHRPLDLNKYKAMIDEAFDEIQQLDCNLIRIHITTSDIADIEGNLVEGRWLDTLDYVMAKAEQRGIYVHLAFLNNLGAVKGSFVFKNAMRKADWMVDPEFRAKAEHYIRQLLNRKNPYNAGMKYKDSQALVIVEPINEPAYFEHQNIKTFPKCSEVYQAWLTASGNQDSQESFLEFRCEHSKNYINRMVRLFRDENVAAVMAWSLGWPRAMEWTGEDIFRAAADSDVEVVAICCYPGQSGSHKKKGEQLKVVGETNYLNYLQRTHDDPIYHGWLLEDRFTDKARIVYEFETYYNHSTYLYPAMAKLFRSLGIQSAAMWTYILPGQAEYTATAHNLNLKTTPNKAAAFMAAGQVMRSQPRFKKYQTSSPSDDYFEHTALSYEHGCSAYADDSTLIYSETMPGEFVKHLQVKPKNYRRIVGRGKSPVVKYDGTGLYFIEATEDRDLRIRLMPDAEFVVPHYLGTKSGEKAVRLSADHTHMFELNLPGFSSNSEVYRMVDGKRHPVKREPSGIRFQAHPGAVYEILK